MKLAVIGKILSVSTIPGADFINAATVVCGDAGKWSGVVGKDVQPGELVTVFLQDAILPAGDERWAFMEKHRWRVRMARFKGVPSECLIIRGAPDMPIGWDLSEELGVVKYHKTLPLGISGEMVASFPDFIPKTDEPNFQTVPDLVMRMRHEAWYATEKADGTSCTVWTDAAGMHVCSRNWELKEFTASGATNAYWSMARKYGMDRLHPELALQFEVVGPGIQGNPMGLKELEVRAFTLLHIASRRCMSQDQLWAFCDTLDIPMAPIVVDSYGFIEDWDPEDLRELAAIKYTNGKHGEGVVIRAQDSSWSFKVINLFYKD